MPGASGSAVLSRTTLYVQTFSQLCVIGNMVSGLAFECLGDVKVPPYANGFPRIIPPLQVATISLSKCHETNGWTVPTIRSRGELM